MESVPETERMEEFRDSRIPSLRLYEVLQHTDGGTDREAHENSRPPYIRRSTDPTPSPPESPRWPSSTLPFRPRNTSPYSHGHLRSRSTASSLTAPMSRAQSLPGVNAAGHLYMSPSQRSSSPRGSPNRSRTPRKPVDEVFPGLPRRTQPFSDSVATISETEETPRAQERSRSPNNLMPNNTFPNRRRPSSPLRNVSVPYSMSGSVTPTTPTTPTGPATSPSYLNSKFNESAMAVYNYPGSSTSSSIPSTPNSIRSRSPSISSLETIPDSPDAEEAALEAERIAQLKADADAADGDEAAIEAKRIASLDSGVRGRSLGINFGSRDKRKRWSVCGAERRSDLDLETIWED